MRRAAIIGAGPSGFYAADQLLKADFEVDLYDALHTPFGLVRFGVAPDHPKIKSVTRVYEKTARHPGFRFFGGVRLGEHVTRAELLERYHAVVYAYGTVTDNRLGIPGEDRPGSHSATEFVAVENAVYTHPAVLECSVVAAPDERWGEIVHAVVVAPAGVQVGPEEIIEHCRQTLAGYKCPKRVTFVDSLPKTAIGKISRKNVKELVR